MRGRTWLSILVLLVLGVGPGVGAATTGNDNEAVLTRVYCVADSPDEVSMSAARQRLLEVITEWETVLNQNGVRATNLSQLPATEPCPQSGVITVGVDNSTSNLAYFNGSEINFRPSPTATDWWDGVGSQGADYSYEGILAHEVGHSLGIWHSGMPAGVWSWDGEIPTMGAGITPSLFEEKASVAQDDSGSVQWVWWLAAPGSQRFFSSDPSFEHDPLEHWAPIESANVDVVDWDPLSGDRSALLSDLNAGYFITSVYDPWKGSNPAGVSAGMQSTVTLQAFTMHKERPGYGGGVTAAFRYQWIDYDPTVGGKAGTLVGSMSSYIVKTCTNTGSYSACARGKEFTMTTSGNTNAVAFRARFLSTGDGTYIDRSGARTP